MTDEERVGELLESAAALAGRLEKGRAAIGAEPDTERADWYFERWLSFLTEYEQTIDELRRMGVPTERLAGAVPRNGM